LSTVATRLPASTPAAVIDVGGSGIAIWSLVGAQVEPILTWEGRATPADVGQRAREAARVGDTVLIATPGVMDSRGLLHASNLAWSGLDLGSAIGLPDHDVRWVNDAAAIAAGEWTLHGLSGRTLVLTFGTGLGVAVAYDGGASTLMLSETRECAHMDTGVDIACACGGRGCVEAVARRWLDEGVDGEALLAAVNRILGMAQADNLVLCGGALRAAANQRRALDLMDHREGVRVVISAAGEDKSAAPHGAASVWPLARRLG
jgi:hypothetical protein